MDLRVALVHDYLLVDRGAERTFAAMAAAWPTAPIHTLLHDPPALAHRFGDRDVRVSALRWTGARQSSFRALLPLLPLAARSMRVGEGADVVVSSSSAFAHGVRTPEGVPHVCYCHSPFRYAWFERERALLEAPAALRPVLGATLGAVRRWDRRAAARVTHYVANGRVTQERIARFYGREAPIVHPPVEVGRFAPGGDRGDHALIVCELVRHKRVDAALAAARRAGVPVRVVGTGADEERLRALHADHATFLGRVDDERLAREYAGARLMIVANVEEFGIAAVEAQAAGCPVVAVGAGGVLETIVDGETGLLVPPGDDTALTEALRAAAGRSWDAARISRNAQRFSPEAFRAALRREVERVAGARTA